MTGDPSASDTTASATATADGRSEVWTVTTLMMTCSAVCALTTLNVPEPEIPVTWIREITMRKVSRPPMTSCSWGGSVLVVGSSYRRQSEQSERLAMFQQFLGDLLRFRDLRQAGELPDQFDQITRIHYRLLEGYVDLLRRTAYLPVLIIGRVETEPGPHGSSRKYRESSIDRLLPRKGLLRPVRLLMWPVLFVSRSAYSHANERAVDRFVFALRPLVRTS